MGVFLVTNQEGVKVYRKDCVSKSNKPYTTYCIRVATNNNNEWVNGFLNIAFKKKPDGTNVSLTNKSTILIKKAFPIVENWSGKPTIKYMITDFEVLEDGDSKSPVEVEEIAESDGLDLPFV